MVGMPKALSQFTPATKRWFEGTFGGPTRVQELGWKALQKGEHALMVAPTGSGKTLAAFLWSIDGLMSRPEPIPPTNAKPQEATGQTISKASIPSLLIGRSNSGSPWWKGPGLGINRGNEVFKPILV